MKDSDYQCKMILFYLKERGSITAKEARRLCGCTSLSAQIRKLKQIGIRIRSETHEYKNLAGNPVRYAIYRLET